MRRGLARESRFTLVLERHPTEMMTPGNHPFRRRQASTASSTLAGGHHHGTRDRPATPPLGGALPNSESFRRPRGRAGIARGPRFYDDFVAVEGVGAVPPDTAGIAASTSASVPIAARR